MLSTSNNKGMFHQTKVSKNQGSSKLYSFIESKFHQERYQKAECLIKSIIHLINTGVIVKS